jgi:molecular chaperone GrpE
VSPEHGAAEPQAGEQPEVVVRDRRRLDPETGEPRQPASGGGGLHTGDVAAETVGSPPAGSDAPGAGQAPDDRVAELTADLQRLSAEYANYRKRVERDRVAVVEMATAGLLNGLLPLLDDVDRARTHGDLTGAFAAVGEGLELFTSKLGLERFGEAGEPFDPAVHEAVMAAEPDPTSSVQVCAAVFSPGFRLSGGRVLRPAKVSVAEPGAAAPDGS